jgi:hypothetical protein
LNIKDATEPTPKPTSEAFSRTSNQGRFFIENLMFNQFDCQRCNHTTCSWSQGVLIQGFPVSLKKSGISFAEKLSNNEVQGKCGVGSVIVSSFDLGLRPLANQQK